MLKKVDIVVFDFDGTLSALDSNVEFAKYCFRHSVRPWLFLPLMGVSAIAASIKPDGIWWRENIRRFLTPALFFMMENLREKFHAGMKTRKINKRKKRQSKK